MFLLLANLIYFEMGYEINSKAYQFLTQIEVGIREFFIFIIKKNGVNDWINAFLGSNQKITIMDLVKNVNDKYKQKLDLDINENYIFKLNRNRKAFDDLKDIYNLCHPFYYLNWPDMEALISTKANSKLFDSSIGKEKREMLSLNLKHLNSLRNDIAHSRYISEDDLILIEGTFKQISLIVPNFSTFCNNQSKEESIPILLNKLSICVTLIFDKDVLSTSEIDQCLQTLDNSINSFWLNSFGNELVSLLVDLNIEFTKYKDARMKPGALLMLLNWKKSNSDLILKIKSIIEDGKI